MYGDVSHWYSLTIKSAGMKTSMGSLLFAFVILLGACSKEDIGPKLQRETKEKIIGRWNVEKIIHQEYEPISTLERTDESTGTAEDYYVFKPTGTVEVNAAPGAKTEVTFEVINPNQIWIKDQSWTITASTKIALMLTKDRNDAVSNKRYVTKIYFKKN